MTVHQIFIACIHFIFPPSDDEIRVEKLTEGSMFFLFRKHQVENVWVVSDFAHPDVRALIHEAKFHNNSRALSLLHILFSKFLDEYSSPMHFIIPIPLSRKRLRERGYNQVLKVLESADTPAHKITILQNVLRRKRHTRPQTDLSRAARLHNLDNAFEVIDGEKICNKHILIVDDVTTTGATLMAAKAALKPYNPASITLFALAH